MKYKIAIIGSGNGGQAMAGHFSMLGHDVSLYSRSLVKVKEIIRKKGILLKEKITGFGAVKLITDKMDDATKEADLIMVVTTADAHKYVARKLAPFLQPNQVVVLNPGRTLGALEFRNEIEKYTKVRVYVAEAQSLIYACRSENNGEVRIIGVKNVIPLAAFPSIDTFHVLSLLNEIHNCFIKAENILETGLENIGAIFHPSLVLFNAAIIERGNIFYFYNDLTPYIAEFLEKIDKERLAIGKAFGFNLLSVSDWVSHSYNDIKGFTLCDKMRNNPAYFKIIGPSQLKSRLIMEDVPTGVLPLIELARIVKVETPLLRSVYLILQSLVKERFDQDGRTLKNLGIEECNIRSFFDGL